MANNTVQLFEPEHLAEIAAAIGAGRPLLCPVCGVPLMVLNVNAGKHALPIEWLVGCTRCLRKVLAKDIKLPSETADAPPAQPPVLPPEAGHLTVLVVDDNPDFRLGVRHVLEALGYGVFEARDGDEALRLLRSNQITVLVVDVFMERMSGIELLRQLRAQRGARPRIVLVTGATHLGDDFAGTMGTLFDADAVLIKPFTTVQLLGALKGDLPAQVMRNSGPSSRAPQEPSREPGEAKSKT